MKVLKDYLPCLTTPPPLRRLGSGIAGEETFVFFSETWPPAARDLKVMIPMTIISPWRVGDLTALLSFLLEE